MTLSILFLGFAALAALALAMPAHARAGFGRDISHERRRLFRAAGWLVVAGLFVVEGWRHGWTIGITYGIASLAVTGFAVTLVLTYRPRVLPLLAVVTLTTASGLLAWVC
jgi:hypothetical protein